MDAPKQRVKELRRQIRLLQQRKRRAEKAQVLRSAQHQPTSSRTLLVYALALQRSDIVVDFVRGCGQHRQQSNEPSSADEATSITACVQAAWMERSAQLGPDPTIWPDVSRKDYRVACRFVLEWRLYSWLWEQNCIHGVAPSRGQLVEQVRLLNADWEVGLRVATWLAKASARTQRKWMASFRRRWRARIGVLKVQDDIPAEVMRAKAGQSPHVLKRLQRITLGSVRAKPAVAEMQSRKWTRLAVLFLGPCVRVKYGCKLRAFGGFLFGTAWRPQFWDQV